MSFNLSSNLSSVFSQISGFASSWIFGVGCSSVSIGTFIQLQRKMASPTVESLTLNYDEYPLQPPAPLDSYSGISETNGATLAAVGGLERLLEEASTLDTDHDNNNGRDPKQTSSYSDLYHSLANQDLISLLAEYDVDLPFLSSTTYELIVKDNGLGLGFGYVGKEATPLSNGDGNLFNLIQTRLAGDWGSLEVDQRIALTADVPARLAVLHSNPNDNAKHLPLATPAPYPLWFLPTLVCSILRDLVKYPAHLTRLKAVRQGSIPYLSYLLSHLHGEDVGDEQQPSKVDVSTPLSAGFGKYFADIVIIHVCTEQSVLQHPKFLQDHDLPLSIDVRAVDASVVRSKASAAEGKSDRWGAGRHSRRFCGTLSSADEGLFTSDTAAVATVEVGGQRKGNETGRPAKREKTKHLPILWMRCMGETRPIWLAR